MNQVQYSYHYSVCLVAVIMLQLFPVSLRTYNFLTASMLMVIVNNNNNVDAQHLINNIHSSEVIV